MINCQCSCNSRIFSLFWFNVLPISSYICQFWLFIDKVTLLGQLFKKLKNFCASRHMLDAMKIFTSVGVTRNGKKLGNFVPGGWKNWNFWPKHFPLRVPKGNWISNFEVGDKKRKSIFDTRSQTILCNGANGAGNSNWLRNQVLLCEVKLVFMLHFFSPQISK